MNQTYLQKHFYFLNDGTNESFWTDPFEQTVWTDSQKWIQITMIFDTEL